MKRSAIVAICLLSLSGCGEKPNKAAEDRAARQDAGSAALRRTTGEVHSTPTDPFDYPPPSRK